MNKILIPAGTALVDELGQDILAGAGFPGQHDRYGGGGQAQGFSIYIVHFLVGNDELLTDLGIYLQVAQMVFQSQHTHAHDDRRHQCRTGYGTQAVLPPEDRTDRRLHSG